MPLLRKCNYCGKEAAHNKQNRNNTVGYSMFLWDSQPCCPSCRTKFINNRIKEEDLERQQTSQE